MKYVKAERINAEQLDAIVALRGAEKLCSIETVLEPSDIEAACENLDEQEVAAFADTCAQIVNTRIEHRKNRSIGAARTASGSQGGPARPLQKKVIVRNELSVDFAALYLPCVRGCRVLKDTTFHYRWQGCYPRPPPLTRWCGQGLGVSNDKDALIFTLRTLWQWHTELNPGAVCPYDFNAEID